MRIPRHSPKESISRAPPALSIAGSAAIVLLLALAAGLLAAGCGDDGGAGSPTATPTPDPDRQLLEQLVLAKEDVPDGLQRVDKSFSTNQDIADASANPEAEMAQLERWGRRLGLGVTYVPLPDPPAGLTIQLVDSSTSLYRSPEGAGASFADAAQSAREQDWAAASPELKELKVKEIKQPELADEILWLRISGFPGEGKSTLRVDDYVLIRQDLSRGFIRVVWQFAAKDGRDAFQEQAADLIRRQVDRVSAALAGG